MTTLKTVLTNESRHNNICTFEMLNDDYAILCLNSINGTSHYTYNIASLVPNEDARAEVMIYADNLKEAIKKTENVIKYTEDFDYSYDDILSKNGTWYKKRRKEKNDNREYKQRYIKLLEFLKTLL